MYNYSLEKYTYMDGIYLSRAQVPEYEVGGDKA